MNDIHRHRFAIFGASGRTGLCVVEEAISRGRDVTAFVRSSVERTVFPREVREVKGSLADPRAIDEAVRHADVVISVLGHRPGDTQPFCTETTARILESMRKQDRGRILCVTGAMIGAYPHRSFFMQKMAQAYRRRQPELARDREEQERLIMASGLDWTIVKPPRLSDGPARGNIRAGSDIPVGLLSSIRRRDLATFLVEQAFSMEYSGRRIVIVG